jgi:ParB family chromosome partitioning protein
MSQVKGLGRGLASLIPDLEGVGVLSPGAAVDLGIESLPVDAIVANPSQPRKEFQEEALKDLAHSIREKGILQPILVRPKHGKYQIVAGERRWRAAKLAGIEKIPSIVRDIGDDAVLQIALIENLQREVLNPVVEAKAYALLHQAYELTHEEIAQKIGKKRVTISNRLRLLSLAPEVQQLIIEKKLTEGHARCLVGIKTDRLQLRWANKIIALEWSVRQVERVLSREVRVPRKREVRDQNPEAAALSNRLSRALGTKVIIVKKSPSRGKIVIDYYSLDDLDRILKFLR